MVPPCATGPLSCSVCVSCLFVTLVYCGQMVGWIKTLGTEVGLGPGDIVLDGDPAPPQRCTGALHFSAHAYCVQIAGWMRIPLGTEVGLGPGDIVLDGDPSPPPSVERDTAAPNFSAHVCCGHTVAHLSNC